jgi:hypothetical protein
MPGMSPGNTECLLGPEWRNIKVIEKTPATPGYGNYFDITSDKLVIDTTSILGAKE